MKKLSFFLLIFAPLLFSCTDDTQEPTPEPDEPTILEGTLVDAAVEGVHYESGSVSGVTDAGGTFEHEEGKRVSFSVGGIHLGEADGQAVISPIELSGMADASISTPKVRNIASFLQSLDEDTNPENGITVSAAVSESLSGESLDFETGNFQNTLKSLLDALNEEGHGLEYVSPNQAARHLANTLEREGEFHFLPTVLQGREWESGTYRAYNTTNAADDAIVFRIFGNADSVLYYFSETGGYQMNMEYQNDTLFGHGNYYHDFRDPGTAAYEYNHRISSPGVAFDYNDSTYLGYYNFQKVEGEAGVLEGTYQNFLFFDRQYFDQEPSIIEVLHTTIVIEENSEEDFNFTITNNRNPDSEPESFLVEKALIDAEQLMLIQLNGVDYLFNKVGSGIGFHPGLFTYKSSE